MEKGAVLKPGMTWKEYFYGQADDALHGCGAYQRLVKLLLDHGPEEEVGQLFREIGLSGNESVGLRTCVHNYLQALEQAPAFPKLNAKMIDLDCRVREADKKLHGEALSDEGHDAAEAELQKLLYEQENLRGPWTRAKLAMEFLPSLRTAMGLSEDRPEAKRES